MKKSLIALAVLAASGAAMAQSSVSLFGIVDVGVSHVTKATAGGKAMNGMTTSGNSTSRIGFRGTEDLGNGLSAVFVLETGFNVDDGALGQGGLLFGRQSFVGLRNSWGTFSFGRQYDLLYAGSPLPLDIGALLLGGLAGATGGAGTAVDNH